MKKILLILSTIWIGTNCPALSYSNDRAQTLPVGTKIVFPDGGATIVLEEIGALYLQKGIRRLSLKFSELNELRGIVPELTNIIRQHELKEGIYKKALGKHWIHQLKDGATYVALLVLITDAVIDKFN